MTLNGRFSTRPGARRRRAVLGVVALAMTALVTGATAGASPGEPPPPPSDSDLIRPLPVVTPVASGWQPKFPFPYDQTRNRVTDADITAMGEMCQWFNLQYATLRAQIDRLQFNRIAPDGNDYDYTRGNIGQQVDIVTGNIAKAVDFLTPRARALTQAQNPFGDNYFPIYQGEAFFKLWEQLSNVNNGILAHQPNWFTGPSVHKAKRWGSDIHRSHVCE
ncbi:hypothetical protein [Mycolicibacterium holsaticum]|nr:hypothetical protein [Mycolicibacterium holsaticum]